MIVRYSERDRRNENFVARIISDIWNVLCYRTTKEIFAAVDFKMIKDGNLVGYFEVKARSNTHDHYPTVYLALRKWSALKGTGLPGYFFWKFTDGVWYVDINTIDASNPTMKGRTDRENAPNDIEPMILVPVKKMIKLER